MSKKKNLVREMTYFWLRKCIAIKIVLPSAGGVVTPVQIVLLTYSLDKVN